MRRKLFDVHVPGGNFERLWDDGRVVNVGTYVNGRRLPLQGRGWGFESLRAYQVF